MKKYIADAQLSVVMARNQDNSIYQQKKYFKKAFKVLAKTDANLCGNIRATFLDNQCFLANEPIDTAVPSYNQISSALALYRTISLFECGINKANSDFYKTNWSVILKHQSTGKILMLGEWKGGFQIFTEGDNLVDLPHDFIADTHELLTFLVSDKITIGYDGVIAGSVA